MKQKTRHLKIFISSTFQDMQEERKILLKEVFLELKKIARERDVEITELDLRWGITQEAADSGKTVKVCLDEIERCKDSPIFFLGMIGSRYGWNEWYEEIDKSILNDERYAWIEEYKDKSITELEIRSVLRKECSNKVLLYIKDNSGHDDNSVIKFKKELIEFSNTKPNVQLDTYTNGFDFRQKVKDDLYRVFDELYPENTKQTELEKLYAPHNNFARQRQLVYVPDKDAYHEMTMFLESEYNVVIVYGKEGSGKSSFISNYFTDNSTKNIIYYLGCSNDIENLRTIIGNIRKLAGLPKTITDRSISIDNFISDFLADIIDLSEELYIVIDGIEMLEKKEQNIFLHHLLEEFEGKKTLAKIIITTREKQTKFELNHPVYPMEIEEKQSLVTQYLFQYGKRLTDEDMYYIVNHENIENIHFFKILLNEIRLLSNFDNFRKDVSNYLRATDTVELFEIILFRYEDDYGEILTQNFCSLLYLVRDGLTEDELFELLNYMQEGEIITRLELSPLFLALEPYLSNTNGSYKLKNKYLREVVEYRYIFASAEENIIRQNLGDYFWNNSSKTVYKHMRKVRETIYQFYEIKGISKIIGFLLDSSIFYALLYFDRDMLWKYMLDINNINNDEKYIDEILSNIIQHDFTPSILMEISEFFSFDLAAKDYALEILFKVESILLKDSTDNRDLLGECYKNISLLYDEISHKWGKEKDRNLALFYAKKATKYIDSPLMLSNENYIQSKKFRLEGKFKKNGLIKYIESLKQKESILGENDVSVIDSYGELGNFCKSEGLYDRADEFFTIQWERTKIHYGELSKESYYSGMKIAALYLEHAAPLMSLEEFLLTVEHAQGKLNDDTVDYFKESYHNRSGWKDEDYIKLLKVSKLLIKSADTYEDELDVKLYVYLAQAYRGVGDMDNYEKYIKFSKKK